jgi:hypothetical protein
MPNVAPSLRWVARHRQRWMDDRWEAHASPAFAALKPSGKRVLRVVERECGGGATAISIARFMESGMGRLAAYYGVKQCERLGFVSVSAYTGPHRANVFTLVDHWRSIDAVEAKRQMAQAREPKPRVAALKPVKHAKPAPTPKPVRPRMNERRTVSLPKFSWDDAGNGR